MLLPWVCNVVVSEAPQAHLFATHFDLCLHLTCKYKFVLFQKGMHGGYCGNMALGKAATAGSEVQKPLLPCLSNSFGAPGGQNDP